MPDVSFAFRVQRLTLAANVLTPVRPLIEAREVSIGNGTIRDLEVHTSTDLTEMLIVPRGFERGIPATFQLYRRDRPAFWLRSVPGGLVVLLWIP